MDYLEEGYLFWKRFDKYRDPNKTLKEFASRAGLNYELIKVQRSLNRIPKAMEVSLIAQKIGVPVEILLQDIDSFPLKQKRLFLIYCELQKTNEENIDKISEILGI
ncbi:MAG: hypothetical protein PQJ47_08230 [Sphaerochaetaceae bacterium]|nr:hypothetical protein [Sphaerochaetaceae bacterium]MDC7247494.1 hypothetical protein [Sphaerochaetaceae bacterium]